MTVTRGRHNRLPVVKLDGQRPIGDSTRIIAALEQYKPDPPLYPSDPDERRHALALEDFFDEELGPYLRTYGWYHLVEDMDSAIDTLLKNHPAWHRRFMHAGTPVVKQVIKLDYKVSPAGAQKSLAKIYAAMDRLEAEIQPSGYLAGDRFSVADLTAAALFTPIVAPPERPYVPENPPAVLVELQNELESRPGGKWILDMYARHRGTSHEVAA